MEAASPTLRLRSPVSSQPTLRANDLPGALALYFEGDRRTRFSRAVMARRAVAGNAPINSEQLRCDKSACRFASSSAE
jgi:hypothetical protein